MISKFLDPKLCEEKVFQKITQMISPNISIVIIGFDLLTYENILKFYSLYGKIISSFSYSIYFLSMDFSSQNLSELSERKKNYIKSKIKILSSVKTKKMNKIKNQCLIKSEIINSLKMTKENGIYELNLIIGSKNTLETLDFEKLSIFLKEHLDIFESKLEEAKEEPSSTFKLTLNQNELQAKNEIILPYIKSFGNQNKDKMIIIDQEDLNELYEEDPDGDLDI